MRVHFRSQNRSKIIFKLNWQGNAPQDVPKTPQGGPKTPPRRPKTPKTAPRRLQKPSQDEVQLPSMLGVHLDTLRGARIVENVERAAPEKTCRWQRTGSALKRKPNARPCGTSRTIDVLKKSFEKSLGIILETSCAIGYTYSELRRSAAHSRERECPHANASWNVSRRP